MAVLPFFLLSACDGGPPLDQSVQQSSASPGKSVWPPASPSGTKFVLSPNLLAKNFMVVFDQSGSMSERSCNDRSQTKTEAAKIALSEFSKTVPESSNLGLVIFDGHGINEKVPMGTGNENRAKFLAQVQASGPGGGTPLLSAVTLGFNKLLEQARKQLGYGEYHLVVVTDGEANSGQDPQKVVEVAAKTPIMIHTIGFCIKGGHSLNQAGITLYQEAGDLASLQKGLRDVLAEAPSFDAKFQ